MNRFIIGRLGLVSFLAALFAAGCAFEQVSGEDDQTGQSDDGSEIAGIGIGIDEQVSAGERPVLMPGSEARRPDNSVCVGCGPLPDPWKKMGPLPDPWTSSSGGGGSTSSSGSSDGSNGGNNSNGK